MSSEMVNIICSESDNPYDLQIFSLDGKIHYIEHDISGNHKVNVNALREGQYFIRISFENGVNQVFRFIKI